MRVLILTWEFPPMITGGLGMACYGIVRELLKQGTEVDLVMPAKKEIYFRLRKPEDADVLPVVFANPGKEGQAKMLISADIRKLLGNPVSVYHTTGHSSIGEFEFERLKHSSPFKRVFENLTGEPFFFEQVRHYTQTAVRIAARLDFDVIHAHDWLTYPAAMLLKRILKKPLVVHVHATEFDRAAGPGDGRIHDIEYLGTKYADAVLTVSDYTSNIVKEKYKINPDKVKVVHNAYSVSNSENNQGRIFKETTVLFLGRITLQKGPDYFLEVARRVLQHEKNVRFVMAGSGDMEKQVLHKAAYWGLKTKFLVAGFLERNEVESILSSTDIFILPSVSEPFGIAPLEAMSYGAVAIISKNAGVAEVIENAYKVDFWDIDKMVSIIIELIRNPEKCREMSMLGKAEVVNLQWKNAVQKIVDVFYRVREGEKCLI